MRVVAFINDAGTMGKILNHIDESTHPPRIAPAHGPPLWEAARQGGDDLMIQPCQRSSSISAWPGDVVKAGF